VKPEHVVAVALRLFAIFLAVSILGSLTSSTWLYITSAPDKGFALIMIASMILVAFVAFALWRYAFWIASKLIRFDDSMTRPPTSWASFEEIQTVAFTVLGVYFSFRAIAEMIYWLSFFIGSPVSPDPQQWALMLRTLADFVLAGFLVFGPRGLGRSVFITSDKIYYVNFDLGVRIQFHEGLRSLLAFPARLSAGLKSQSAQRKISSLWSN